MSTIAIKQLVRQFRGIRPGTRGELGAWVEAFLGLRVPGRAVCPGHAAPLDYLAAVMGIGEERFEIANLKLENENSQSKIENLKSKIEKDNRGQDAHATDLVVWANRGGGKTQLGAVATLLESIFRPGCETCILAGSEDQSQRMYDYLRGFLDRGFGDLLEGRITREGCTFRNGSRVASLAQSDRSVRGRHVQRLRCDEVELFDRDVWQACQFITHSRRGIPARLEALSTQHRAAGLMHELVRSAAAGASRLFHWCLWEVIEPCRDRTCSACPLWEDCGGRAREAAGYYSIDDAIAQKRRSSAAGWRSEMLCLEAAREDVVFAEFRPAVHVRDIKYSPDLPLYRSLDFGFSNPLACVFIQLDPRGRVLVIDEHLKSRTTLAEQARLIRQRYPQRVEATYCDPAGAARHEITGTSLITELAACGIPVRYRPSRVLDGVELIRQYLAPASGEPRLIVAPACTHLIAAFQNLRFERLPSGAWSEQPAKDGVHDHVLDALRYFFVNRLSRPAAVKEKRY